MFITLFTVSIEFIKIVYDCRKCAHCVLMKQLTIYYLHESAHIMTAVFFVWRKLNHHEVQNTQEPISVLDINIYIFAYIYIYIDIYIYICVCVCMYIMFDSATMQSLPVSFIYKFVNKHK